jgi:hypothetical protein
LQANPLRYSLVVTTQEINSINGGDVNMMPLVHWHDAYFMCCGIQMFLVLLRVSLLLG